MYHLTHSTKLPISQKPNPSPILLISQHSYNIYINLLMLFCIFIVLFRFYIVILFKGLFDFGRNKLIFRIPLHAPYILGISISILLYPLLLVYYTFWPISFSFDILHGGQLLIMIKQEKFSRGNYINPKPTV